MMKASGLAVLLVPDGLPDQLAKELPDVGFADKLTDVPSPTITPDGKLDIVIGYVPIVATTLPGPLALTFSRYAGVVENTAVIVWGLSINTARGEVVPSVVPDQKEKVALLSGVPTRLTDVPEDRFTVDVVVTVAMVFPPIFMSTVPLPVPDPIIATVTFSVTFVPLVKFALRSYDWLIVMV
jgi:hypothetical protein